MNLLTEPHSLASVLSRVSIAMIKHHNQKQLRKERGDFTTQLLGHTPSLREVGQDLKAGTHPEADTDLEAVEEHCLLSLLSYHQCHCLPGG